MHPLLAAILAAPPGDLAHHEVYADALQVRGDPRGELIAIELALAAAPGRAELAARRAALCAAHGAAWWPGIPTAHVRTRHGFVEAIAIPATEIERAVELARREPLRTLELCGPVHAEVIARVPPVATLVAREIENDGIAALASAPCAATLRALDISGSDYASTFPADLPALDTLAIAATWIETDELERWPHLGALRALDVSLPRDRSLETHRALHGASRLEILRASCVEGFATPETVAALAAAPALTHLVVRGCLERAEAAALRAALPHVEVDLEIPARVSLDLFGCTLTFAATGEAFRDGVRVPLLTHYTQTDCMTSSTKLVLDAPEPTGLLVDAIACGAPRIITATGCTVRAALLPYDNIVDAKLDVSEARIDLALGYYVD